MTDKSMRIERCSTLRTRLSSSSSNRSWQLKSITMQPEEAVYLLERMLGRQRTRPLMFTTFWTK